MRQGWDRLLETTEELLDDVLDLDVAAERSILDERIEPGQAAEKGLAALGEMVNRQRQFEAEAAAVLEALKGEIREVEEKTTELKRLDPAGKLKRLFSTATAEEDRGERSRTVELDASVRSAADSVAALADPLDLAMVRLAEASREWAALHGAIPKRVQDTKPRVDDARKKLKVLERRRAQLAEGENPQDDETGETLEDQIRDTTGLIQGFEDVRVNADKVGAALRSGSDVFAQSASALCRAKSGAVDAAAKLDQALQAAEKLVPAEGDGGGESGRPKAAPTRATFEASFALLKTDPREVKSRLHAATQWMRATVDRAKALERRLKDAAPPPR